jgi:hypothetical protein
MAQGKPHNEATGNREGRRASIWLVSAFTIAAAIIANLIVRGIAFALLPLSAEFPPLMVQPVILFTLVGVAAAAGVYALLRSFTTKAVPVYRAIAVVALLMSLIPNFQMLSDPAAVPFPGTTALAIWVLMAFHLVAALVSTSMLTRLAPPAQEVHPPSRFLSCPAK